MMFNSKIFKLAKIKYLCAIAMFSFVATSASANILTDSTPNSGSSVDSPLYYCVDVMPTFKGGDIVKFHKWVTYRVDYPALAVLNNIEGTVTVSFVVNTDGSVSNVTIVDSPDPMLSDAVVRLLNASPRWGAGMHDGKAVRVAYTIPVTFVL